MIPDNKTNTIYLADILKPYYPKTWSEINKALKSFNITPQILLGTKDVWARDYMPIQVTMDKFVEYRYDPDYLQGDWRDKDTREYKTYPDIVCAAINQPTIKADIILDGGNIVKSSNCVIMTDKVIQENKRTYNKTKLLDKLYELFEVDKVILIPWDDKCRYGHADGMLRFINDTTVLISGFYEQVDDEFKEMILKPLKKAKLDYEWLRCSNKEVEKNIFYINFLQTEDLILGPKLNRKTEDDEAVKEISKYFPEYAKSGRIGQVEVNDVAKWGGALNCISWSVRR